MYKYYQCWKLKRNQKLNVLNKRSRHWFWKFNLISGWALIFWEKYNRNWTLFRSLNFFTILGRKLIQMKHLLICFWSKRLKYGQFNLISGWALIFWEKYNRNWTLFRSLNFFTILGRKLIQMKHLLICFWSKRLKYGQGKVRS